MVRNSADSISSRTRVSIEPGVLYVVATPLGNLGDLSPRGRSVLRDVDAIYAEDTRRSSKLLGHFEIDTPLHSLHEHNEDRLAPRLVARLAGGDALALVSDAGTPLISDPGYRVVRAVRAKGLRAVPVPGPCALVCALSVAGLPTDRFVFEGFLPAREAARRSRLELLVGEERTLVFYEAPHRVVPAVGSMVETLGPDREAVVARELTKRFETIFEGTLGSVAAWLDSSPDNRRGEFVLVVAGAPGGAAARARAAEGEHALEVLLGELSPKQAVSLAARLTGASRNQLYRRAVEITRGN